MIYYEEKVVEATGQRFDPELLKRIKKKRVDNSDCGAGSKGGKGFVKGNTCASGGDGLTDSQKKLGTELKDFVTRVAGFYGEHQLSAESLALKHGELKAGSKLPKGLKRGEQKECFKNSLLLALTRPGYTYVEGFAMSEGLPLGIKHAWNMDKDGNVVDTTWKNPEKSMYLGVEYAAEDMQAYTKKTGTLGLSPWIRDVPLPTPISSGKDMTNNEDTCGAGSKGGSGFEKGNTCAGGSSKGSKKSSPKTKSPYHGDLSTEQKNRLVKTNESIMKLDTQEVGHGSHKEKRHTVTMLGKEVGTVVERSIALKASGTEKSIRAFRKDGKEVGAGYKSVSDAKNGLARDRVERLIKKANTPTDNEDLCGAGGTKEKPGFQKGNTCAVGRKSLKTRSGEVLEPARKAGKVWQDDTTGKAAPKHVQAAGIPPAWTDVYINPDPKGVVVARGVDAKGRIQMKYSDTHNAKQAAAKFGRTKELMQVKKEIFKELAADAKDPKLRDKAHLLSLVMRTGMRPGSDEDTGADYKSYGATTLEGRHVISKPDGSVVLRLVTGKNKGREVEFAIDDKKTATMLTRRAKRSGPDGRLFDVSASSLRMYSKTKGGGGFKTKDHRTALGTETAIAAIKKAGRRQKFPSMKSYKEAVKEVATKVANTLGNTPSVALKSYIDPTAFAGWSFPKAKK